MPDQHEGQQAVLGAMPLRTVQYFCMYFLNLPNNQASSLPKGDLVEHLLHAGKGHEAISLYQEADSYITHNSTEYEFYLWYEQETSCRHLTLTEILHLLEKTEYFGKAVCVMLMECGEVAISGGILYALKKPVII
jgi:hypothetical protein